MARRKLIHWVSTGDVAVTTVGAVAADAVTFDLSSASAHPDGIASDNCCIDVEAHVLGYSTAGGNGVVNRVVQANFSRIGGAVTAIAPIQTIIGVTAALVGALTTVDNNGNVIRVRVTGVAAFTIDWFADARIRIYQPA